MRTVTLIIVLTFVVQSNAANHAQEFPPEEHTDDCAVGTCDNDNEVLLQVSGSVAKVQGKPHTGQPRKAPQGTQLSGSAVGTGQNRNAATTPTLPPVYQEGHCEYPPTMAAAYASWYDEATVGATNTAQMCHQACIDRPACKFFAYWHGSGWCNLLTACYSTTSKSGGSAATVYKMPLPPLPAVFKYNTKCDPEGETWWTVNKNSMINGYSATLVEEGTGYGSHNTVERCYKACAQLSACKFFEFHHTSGWCCLLSSCDIGYDTTSYNLYQMPA